MRTLTGIVCLRLASRRFPDDGASERTTAHEWKLLDGPRDGRLPCWELPK